MMFFETLTRRRRRAHTAGWGFLHDRCCNPVDELLNGRDQSTTCSRPRQTTASRPRRDGSATRDAVSLGFTRTKTGRERLASS